MALQLKLRALLKLNYRLFLDMSMLREGAFIQVPSGESFYDGSDMSLLLPDTEADQFFGLPAGSVWQSPYRQWVYESGVPIDGMAVVAPPIVASGLFIEGGFRPTNDSDFPHTIDYLNGRIFFESPQSLDLIVNGDFSTREVRMGFEHEFNQQAREGYLESKYTTNPFTSQNLVYPSGSAQPFPAVFLEVDERDFEAYELGNRSSIIKDTIKLHVWALNDMQRDNIVDILTAQIRKALPIIDFNVAPLPLSGIKNTLSNEYVPYQEMLRNRELITTVGSGTPLRYINYIDSVTSKNLSPSEEYERSIVTFHVSSWLNNSTQPLGFKWEAISALQQISDPAGWS